MDGESGPRPRMKRSYDIGRSRHWISKIVRARQLAPSEFWKFIARLDVELDLAAQARAARAARAMRQ